MSIIFPWEKVTTFHPASSLMTELVRKKSMTNLRNQVILYSMKGGMYYAERLSHKKQKLPGL